MNILHTAKKPSRVLAIFVAVVMVFAMLPCIPGLQAVAYADTVEGNGYSFDPAIKVLTVTTNTHLPAVSVLTPSTCPTVSVLQSLAMVCLGSASILQA